MIESLLSSYNQVKGHRHCLQIAIAITLLCLAPLITPSNAGAMDSIPGLTPSKDGLQLGLSFGHGQFSSGVFKKKVPTLEAGLHAAYDFQIFPFLGFGLGSSVHYDYQIVEGADVGGTYSGLRLNPVQPRAVLYLGLLTLSYEHYLLSSFRVTRKTVAGNSLGWQENNGFEAAVILPLKIVGAEWTLYYSQNEYLTEKLGGTQSDLKTPVRFSIWGFRLTFRPFSSSLDTNYY